MWGFNWASDDPSAIAILRHSRADNSGGICCNLPSRARKILHKTLVHNTNQSWWRMIIWIILGLLSGPTLWESSPYTRNRQHVINRNRKFAQALKIPTYQINSFKIFYLKLRHILNFNPLNRTKLSNHRFLKDILWSWNWPIGGALRPAETRVWITLWAVFSFSRTSLILPELISESYLLQQIIIQLSKWFASLSFKISPSSHL